MPKTKAIADKLFNALVKYALVVFQGGFDHVEDGQITMVILTDLDAQPFLQNVSPAEIDEAVAEARKQHEAAEARKVLFKELPREVFVEIDIRTAKWGKADPDYYKKNPLVINGFQVPHRFVVDACEAVNRKREVAMKKWQKDIDAFLLEEIGKRFPDFINVKELTSCVINFRGKNVEKERIGWACRQIIEKRREEKKAAWIEESRRKTQPKASQPQISKKVFTTNRYAFLRQDRHHSNAATAAR